MSARSVNTAVAASNTVPPGYAEGAPASQAIGGRGLSFEDLRVDPLGKVPNEIGFAEMPARAGAPNSACPGPRPANSEC